MARLPAEIRAADAIRVFKKVGFARQGRGSGTSHERLKRPGPNGTVTVVHPTMGVGLLKRCLRDAAMSREEFLELYGSL